MNKYCFIVPIFNHGHKLKSLVFALQEYKFPIILIDDGSNNKCKIIIRSLVEKNNDLILLELPDNQGKGAAVMAGFNRAIELEFTHGVQIDADFQHDVNDVKKFVEESNSNALSLICGVPKYDETVPKGRLYSRYITHVWVWINTLSTEIQDSMCGYRIYPLTSVIKLINEVNIGKRMNFDIEIIVHLKWRNVEIINVPTQVIYHDDVPSNFRLFKDNVGISVAHAKMFFGMLIRFPMLMLRKFNGK